MDGGLIAAARRGIRAAEVAVPSLRIPPAGSVGVTASA
jgi:hypothetical protein